MKKALLSITALALTAVMSTANEHTLVFDGENDMYGIPRQTTTDVNSLEFVPEISFTEAGIDFSIKKVSETGYGFALINAGGNNAGLCVYSGLKSETSITPQITLTVPNGKISAVKFYMSAAVALHALSLDFNGKEVDSEKEGSLYYWAWSDAEGTETVTIEWNNTYYARYIHYIEVTYTRDLGGKQESGLAFSENAVEGIIGEEFTPPVLSNPNNLPLTWTSTDENVATVDADGAVTLVGSGKTVITVATPGNDLYAEGNARYELHVIPMADNLVGMLEVAPEVYDRVKVNCPLTVTFANGAFAFVLDPDGNAGYINDIRNQGSTSTTGITIYKVGEVIPAGWIATNATIYGSAVWEGIPDDVTESVEVEYPVVESVTPEDVDRVVILEKVTFTGSTASGNTKAYGTTPDGTCYEFQDTYNAKIYPAGTYDVTCIVRYWKAGSTVYFYLAPIAYEESKESGIGRVEADSAGARYFNLHGIETTVPQPGVYVKVSGGRVSKVVVR